MKNISVMMVIYWMHSLFYVCGAMLNQTDIDKMLEDLAESSLPVIKQRPKAFRDCGVGRAVEFEYCCPICTTRTYFHRDALGIRQILKQLRKNVSAWQVMGLDIKLDERALCTKCSFEVVPTKAEIVSLPNNEAERLRFPWRIGDKIEIHSVDGDCVWFEPLKNDFWVWEKYVTPEGRIALADNTKSRVEIAYARMHPDIESAVVLHICGGEKVIRLPSRPDDPHDWVRIRASYAHGRTTLGGDVFDFMIPIKYVGKYEFCSASKNELCPGRIRALAWQYGGRRTVIRSREHDIAILTAFLNRDRTYSIWEHGAILPLKSQLPRLRRILQGIKEATSEIPIRGKMREHGMVSRID